MKPARLLMMMILGTLAVPGLADALPDPTRPAEYQLGPLVQELPKELVDWRVTAIRISETDRSAIVNGRIVRAGDVIGPAKVVEIQPIMVLLDYDNRSVAVRLLTTSIQMKSIESNVKTESTIQ